MANVILLEELL